MRNQFGSSNEFRRIQKMLFAAAITLSSLSPAFADKDKREGKGGGQGNGKQERREQRQQERQEQRKNQPTPNQDNQRGDGQGNGKRARREQRQQERREESNQQTPNQDNQRGDGQGNGKRARREQRQQERREESNQQTPNQDNQRGDGQGNGKRARREQRQQERQEQKKNQNPGENAPIAQQDHSQNGKKARKEARAQRREEAQRQQHEQRLENKAAEHQRQQEVRNLRHENRLDRIERRADRKEDRRQWRHEFNRHHRRNHVDVNIYVQVRNPYYWGSYYDNWYNGCIRPVYYRPSHLVISFLPVAIVWPVVVADRYFADQDILNTSDSIEYSAQYIYQRAETRLRSTPWNNELVSALYDLSKAAQSYSDALDRYSPYLNETIYELFNLEEQLDDAEYYVNGTPGLVPLYAQTLRTIRYYVEEMQWQYRQRYGDYNYHRPIDDILY